MVFYFEVLAEVMEKLMCRGCQREICSGGQKPILKFAFVLFIPSLRSRETSSVSFHNRTEPFQIKQERKKCPDVVPVSNLKSRMQGWLLGWLNIPKCISSCFHGSRSEAGGKGEKEVDKCVAFPIYKKTRVKNIFAALLWEIESGELTRTYSAFFLKSF